MRDQTRRSAEGEPWWPEFAESYGKEPLRALARRFGTNPRRLRRAAQRSGLAPEPEVLSRSAHLLGTQPDRTLADRLGVTRQHVAGARRRRNIAPYDPKKVRQRRAQRHPAPRRRPAPPGSPPRLPTPPPPRRPRHRPPAEPEVVVVRRRRAGEPPTPSREPDAGSRFRVRFRDPLGEEGVTIVRARHLLDAARQGERYGEVLSVERV